MVTNNLERLASARMLAAAGLLLAHAVSAAPATPMAVAAPEAQIAIREIKWQELVPKDWNPKQYLPDRRLSFLSDMDPDAELAFVEMRRAWDNAPTVIGLDGVNVKLAGYLVPLEETRDGIKEFLLVPYFGACIHSPPPPANQIVDVVLKTSTKAFHAMDTVWVNGTFATVRQASSMGTSGYKIEAASIDRYVAPER